MEYHFPPGEGVWRGSYAPSTDLSSQNDFFKLEMACFGAFWAVFLSVSSPEKNVEFYAWSGDLVNVKDVLLGTSAYSVGLGVMGLVSILLHCLNASNLVLEILKHDKIIPQYKSRGTRFPVIYASVDVVWSVAAESVVERVASPCQ